jgi:hypothetical protein
LRDNQPFRKLKAAALARAAMSCAMLAANALGRRQSEQRNHRKE